MLPLTDPYLQRLNQALTQQRQSYLWRQIKTAEQGHGRWLQRDQQRWLNFASNDYLGLAQHPRVVQAACESARRYGIGSGGPALITGHHRLHAELEEKLQALSGKPRVLLFNSGFSANQGVLSTLMTSDDLIVQDKLNHASLLDGARASRATSVRFLHNDVASAKRQLARAAQGKLLVTESVFSMDGDQAPLAELASVCQQSDALFMVDDAHGLGVIGAHGLGANSVIEPNAIDLYMATFGKALGVGGAMIACNDVLADYLTQFCRHYIYTTAMPLPQAAAVIAALDCLQQEPEHGLKLQANIALFRQLAEQSGIPLMPSLSAIQPIAVAGGSHVMNVAQAMAEHGIVCGAIRAPTVKAGQERLRLTISASHEPLDIQQCIHALRVSLDSLVIEQ